MIVTALTIVTVLTLALIASQHLPRWGAALLWLAAGCGLWMGLSPPRDEYGGYGLRCETELCRRVFTSDGDFVAPEGADSVTAVDCSGGGGGGEPQAVVRGGCSGRVYRLQRR